MAQEVSWCISVFSQTTARLSGELSPCCCEVGKKGDRPHSTPFGQFVEFVCMCVQLSKTVLIFNCRRKHVTQNLPP